MEEFECLLEESPTNYPKGEGIENMESELHSAAIDTELYEQQSIQTTEETEGSQVTNIKVLRYYFLHPNMFCFLQIIKMHFQLNFRMKLMLKLGMI